MNSITRKRKFRTERNYIVVTSNSGVRKVIGSRIKCPIFAFKNKICSKNFIN